MTSRFNNLKQAIIQADKRKLAIRTYAGIGGLVAGAVIVTSIRNALIVEEILSRLVKHNYVVYGLEPSGKLKAGTFAFLESLPIAIFAGATWPLMLVKAFVA